MAHTARLGFVKGSRTMDSKTDKNWSVFTKTDKIGLIRFCQLIKNRSVEFEILKRLKVKILKTSLHFKIFGQNRILKIEITCHTKFIEV
jgi:hypothetical protein